MTALLAALCAAALWPDLPGARSTVIRRVQLLDAVGAPLGEVRLRHLEPGATGDASIRRFRLTLPAPTFAGPEGVLVIGAMPNFRALDHTGREFFATPAWDRRDGEHSTSDLKPHLLKLPAFGASLGGEPRTIDLEMRGHPLQALGLAAVLHGPVDELQSAYKRRYYFKWVGVHVLIVAYLLAAVGALAFWNSDRGYKSPGWFACFCGSAAVAVSMGMATESPPVAWPPWLHGAMFMVGLTSAFLAQFVFEKTGWRTRASDRALMAMVAALAVLGVVLYDERVPFVYSLVVDIVCVVLGCVLVFALVVSLVRRFDPLNAVLLAGVGLSLLFGVHSVAVGWWLDFDGSGYSLQFAPLPITITMGWVVIGRYARMKLRTDALNRRLARRVAARERQLAEAFDAIAQLRQDEAVRVERERFMQDMHDGLGAQLITSLRMAQRGALSPEELRGVLQECLDELRLSIDALRPATDGLLAALGNYRYRMQPRLEAAGVTLSWRMDAWPEPSTSPAEPPAMPSGDVAQVLRILNEALTNALKHGGGRSIAVRGEARSDGYRIEIADDGAGFDATAAPRPATDGGGAPGVGLASMRQRAERIGATLTIASGPGGTQVSLWLPSRPAGPAPLPYTAPI